MLTMLIIKNKPTISAMIPLLILTMPWITVYYKQNKTNKQICQGQINLKSVRKGTGRKDLDAIFAIAWC